jgi:hypothetical protein
MEIFMKENGKTIKPMERVTMHILMGPDMKAHGSRINSTEKAQKPGQMEPNILEIMN